MKQSINHDIPLDLLLMDASAALDLIELHGLSRACVVAHAILSGEPVLGESFIADILLCIEAAKQHAHHNTDDTRVTLISAIDSVETWGLEPERRMTNGIREIVASLEAVRQQSLEAIDRGKAGVVSKINHLEIINQIAQRALAVLGFREYVSDVISDQE